MKQFSTQQLKKHPLIGGTIILTLAGLFSRLIGFFLRIYLSHNFTEEEIGIYQLISPILALTFVITAAGIQTAISSFVAKYISAREENRAFHTFIAALLMGLILSALTTFFLYSYADLVATHFLYEIRTAPLIRIVALTVPFACIHSCVNGFCYGVKKSGFPAFSQLLEQGMRFLSIVLIGSICLTRNTTPTITIAAIGILVGEIIASLASFAYLFSMFHKMSGLSLPSIAVLKGEAISLLHYFWPLTAGRLVVNLLLSLEAAQMPKALMQYGLSNTEALGVYGVLTGMSLPFLLFPSAITGSLSVMLLPHISEAEGRHNKAAIGNATRKCVIYSFLLGFLCTFLFYFFGGSFASFLFQNETAGSYVTSLSFLCPFIYLTSIGSSILNGLGRTKYTFFAQCSSLLVKLAFVYFLIPIFGIGAYFSGLLTSHILLSIFYLLALRKYMYYSNSGN